MDWQPIETAPRDGTRILAVANPIGDRWEYLAGRWFVIHHLETGWAVFPGFSAGDDFFSCWLPLDALPPPPQTDSDRRE
jgi:hypothetical protein